MNQAREVGRRNSLQKLRDDTSSRVYLGTILVAAVPSVSNYMAGNFWLGHAFAGLALLAFGTMPSMRGSRWAFMIYGASAVICGISFLFSMSWLLAVIVVTFIALVALTVRRQRRNGELETIS